MNLFHNSLYSCQPALTSFKVLLILLDLIEDGTWEKVFQLCYSHKDLAASLRASSLGILNFVFLTNFSKTWGNDD